MHPSTAQAEVLVDELVRCGVTDAVLCPGSRNAPLSFALRRADVDGRLRLHVRIDERTAGFLALGIALRSGRAVPVVCTSGTAAANLHPAVLEASYAGVPLLALTADRPPQLVGTGANQTVGQPGIYAGAPRLEIDLGVAVRAVGQQAGWRASAARAVGVALGRTGAPPGPVHVNVPFAEPLVPEVGPEVGSWPEPPVGRRGAWTEFPPVEASAPVLDLDPSAPTLVVGGSVPGASVPGASVPGASVSGASVAGGSAAGGSAAGGGGAVAGAPAGLGTLSGGLPVVAEPSSPLWPLAVRTGAWLLDSAVGEALRPRQVLLHGRPTLHRAVSRLLADPEVEMYALAGTVDPGGAGLPVQVRAVGRAPELDKASEWASEWAQRWMMADGAASAALDRALAEQAAPVGLRLAAALVAGLPAGAVLTLGSSNPVRDVSLAAVPRTGLRVLANRGVAGIDGTVSTSAGAALAHAAEQGGPGFALLGDLTLLHDLTGLVLGPQEPQPDLTIVVLNDSGGGIFSLLEQGAPEHSAAFERVFGTPHQVRLDRLCAGLGVGYRKLDDPDRLAAALEPGEGGIRVIEVPASRAALRDGHAAIRNAINQALTTTATAQ